ncbi:hypothetical protein Hanom_Chr09g00781091 [Helianthus anomalus]
MNKLKNRMNKNIKSSTKNRLIDWLPWKERESMMGEVMFIKNSNTLVNKACSYVNFGSSSTE